LLTHAEKKTAHTKWDKVFFYYSCSMQNMENILEKHKKHFKFVGTNFVGCSKSITIACKDG